MQQGATNRVHNIQLYANKFAMCVKFLEEVQSFVRKYNKLLLSFIYFDLFFSLVENYFGFLFISIFLPECLGNV